MRYGAILKLGAIVCLTTACSAVPPSTTPIGPHEPHRRPNVEEWRSAQALADAYIPEVQGENTIPLGRATYVPFALYINTMHRRLHAVFEQELKAAREAYPELLDAADMAANIEIVLAQEDGHLARLGVVKSSGSIVFDAVALTAVRRAALFGAPSPSIVSPGGKVYVHWTFNTDSYKGCVPPNARPYRLAR